MEHNFWHERWQSNKIGFHESEENRLLVAHFAGLNLASGARVFVPLCGKSLDIHWLLDQGCQVVGIELSKLAVEQLFDGLGVEPEIAKHAGMSKYSTLNLEVFVGDVFELSSRQIGLVDAIYDRAALVALPPDTRVDYTKRLIALCGAAPQLLITFEYDQSLMPGPPFSITQEEVRRHYQSAYQLTSAQRVSLENGLKGKLPAVETAWLLRPRP